MLFNSYIFILVFLPIVLIGYALLRSKAPFWPISWIVSASLFYYGWWKPAFLLLLVASITINLALGKVIIGKKLSQTASRWVLTLGICFNLGALAYFKYAGFLISNINEIFGAGLPDLHILLPIGISFITFQKIAFLVDAHRGLVRNFSILNYIFFVTFFPQLIAGPIVHHAEIMPQLTNAPRREFKADLAVGASILIVGLFKKVVIADSLSVYADAGYLTVHNGHMLDAASAWITALSYTLQLYFDFSGYSDMAIGHGRMFGIQLPLNFFSPYKANSIIDFWRRWHITLSRFLREYLYIPLGGNRHGLISRNVNLALVMLLGGLWHGANWTLAIWGGIHGLLLALNHAWRKLPFTQHRFYRSRTIRTLSIILTFLLVTLAWVPFRAESIADARSMMTYLFPTNSLNIRESFIAFWHAQATHLGSSMSEWFKPRELWPTTLPPDYLATMAKPAGALIFFTLIMTFILPNTSQFFSRFKPALGTDLHPKPEYGALHQLNTRAAIVLAFMFVVCILKLSHVSPFLYFQF